VECAVLVKLRDELKAGNLSVRHSKRFARLDDFFIDDRRWQTSAKISSTTPVQAVLRGACFGLARI
jgi:hypothetical protein